MHYTIKPSTVLALAGKRHAQRDRALAYYIMANGSKPSRSGDYNNKPHLLAFDADAACVELRNGTVTRHAVRIDILAAWCKTWQKEKLPGCAAREPEIELEIVNGNCLRLRKGGSEAMVKDLSEISAPFIGSAFVLEAPQHGGEFKLRGATEAKDEKRAAAELRRRVESVLPKLETLAQRRKQLRDMARKVKAAREYIATSDVEIERGLVRVARLYHVNQPMGPYGSPHRVSAPDNKGWPDRQDTQREERLSAKRGIVRRWLRQLPSAREKYVALVREIRKAIKAD